MKKFICVVAMPALFCSCEHALDPSGELTDVLDQLQSLAGVEVSEIRPENGYSRQFELYIRQPLDHNNPEGPGFQQRVFISHKAANAPVIFMPSGYSSSPVKVSELAAPLGANQVYAAHRFMAGAEPALLDWQYLTIAQASADFHAVADLIKQVYPGPWLSYGSSKNGQAALFHKRFFPGDVRATVALCAPLSRGTEDPRYELFLDQAGSAACREKIRNFQRSVLDHRDQIQLAINTYIGQSEFSFTRMDPAEILEFEVLEYPFSFWQVTDGNCAGIPDSTATATELFNYIKDFGYLDFYSDALLEYYRPVYYQAYTELGWYRLIDDHLKDLLLTDPSYRLMAPQNTDLSYNPAVLQDVREWLAANGNNIIYIYGGNDPWTAGAIESVGATNAIKIVQPGANHTVTIEGLDARSLVYAKLNEWLDIKPVE